MKTALITGGTGGIGAAICRRLGVDGVSVAVGYCSRPVAAQQLAGELGGMAVHCDVTNPASCQKAVDNVLEKFCQLDILICCSGIAHMGLLQDMSETDWRRVMSVDLDGVFHCCKAAIPPMIARKTGKIITISSMWGEVGASCEVAYSAAKAGVIGLTKALAKELAPSGILVNCVSPGVIDTPMNQTLGPQDLAALREEIPLGKIGTPEDVAGAVSYLCSDAADYVTGQVIGVNGGMVI